MHKCIIGALAALLSLSTAWNVSAQSVMACGLGTNPLIHAEDALVGQTVKVWHYLDEPRRGERRLEAEPLVRKFESASLLESLGSDSVTNEITYEGPYWCRFDALHAKKKCYGVMVGSPDQAGKPQFFEVEAAASSDSCAQIVGVMEGVKIPESGIPQPTRAPRRKSRSSAPTND